MEVVLASLENTSITPSQTDNRTNYDILYKNWGRLGNQDERRQQILEVQKTNRHSKVDKSRGILDLVASYDRNSIFRDHSRAFYTPSIYVAGFNKVRSYSEVLMMSEWMIEKPADFEKNWVVVPAPKGTRTLVVAYQGVTRLFTKHGVLLLNCKTGLPGGYPSEPRKGNCCVLDGFYQKKTNTLYILDILLWNLQTMTDGEFEFRDFWMRSQLPELRHILSINKNNELNFNLLPKVSCEAESFKPFMKKMHFDTDVHSLDGLLFYHKHAHYTSGETPLVGWLFPYMVPEILGSDIEVHPAYMLQKPANYTDQATFIIQFDAKMKQKNQRKPRRNTAREDIMDTADTKIKNETVETAPIDETPANANTESMEAEVVNDSTAKEDVVNDSTAKEDVPKEMAIEQESKNDTSVADMEEAEATADTGKKD